MLPDLPSDSPLRRSRESSIIKRYPDFTYSKGWKSELCFNISYPMVLVNIGISACTQASLTHRATVASLDYSVHLGQKNLVSLHCDRIIFIHKYIFFLHIDPKRIKNDRRKRRIEQLNEQFENLREFWVWCQQCLESKLFSSTRNVITAHKNWIIKKVTNSVLTLRRPQKMKLLGSKQS